MRGGKRKGAGRPAGSKGKGEPKTKRVMIRLTKTEFKRIQKMAIEKGITITELIRSKISNI